MLCSRCTKLFRNLEPSRKAYREISYYDPLPPSFQRCSACKLFYGTHRYPGRRRTDTKWIRISPIDFVLELKIHDPTDPAAEPRTPLFQATRIDRHHRTSRLHYDINQKIPNTRSDVCFSLARRWIKYCQENHKCGQHQPTARQGWNPTRLVAIEDDGNGSKLCEGNQIGPSVQYATLSHCWGQIGNSIVLKQENRASFQSALPGSSLPQTFKDAITAANALGLKYIWIDSLCIIQDSEDDWSNESAQMGKIYECSAVTITATSSKDDNGGCFFDRDMKDRFPTRISVTTNKSRYTRRRMPLRVSKRTSIAPKTVFDLNVLLQFDWMNDVENAAINRRGWVLQERFLSPRILHYSTHQLYWECNEIRASESCPGGIAMVEGEHYNCSTPRPVYLEMPRVGCLSMPQDIQSLFRKNVIRTWMDIVEHYTKRDLTKKKDKLPAISAVARKAYQILKCDYLAGLWKGDLVYELGWVSDISERPDEETGEGHETQSTCNSNTKKGYRAPSWSWASVDGSVTYPYNIDNIGSGNNHSLIEYIGHEIKLRNNKDLYGEVKDSNLTVKAQTINVTLTERFIVGTQEASESWQVSVCGHIVDTQGKVYLDGLEREIAPDPYEVLAMPLLLSFSSHKFFLVCLLLAESGLEVYERVGAVYWHTRKKKLKSDSGLRELVRQLGTSELDVESCVDFQRNIQQLREIRIV